MLTPIDAQMSHEPQFTTGRVTGVDLDGDLTVRLDDERTVQAVHEGFEGRSFKQTRGAAAYVNRIDPGKEFPVMRNLFAHGIQPGANQVRGGYGIKIAAVRTLRAAERGRVRRSREAHHHSSLVFKTATKALWGIITDPTHFHLRLSFFLLLQKLALTGNIPAVALGGNVLSKRRDCGSRNDLAPDGPLYGNLELMPRDFLLEAVANLNPPFPGPLLENYERQRIHLLAVDQDIQFDQVAVPILDQIIIEGTIPLRDRLQFVVKIEDDLGQRHIEDDLDTAGATDS